MSCGGALGRDSGSTQLPTEGIVGAEGLVLGSHDENGDSPNNAQFDQIVQMNNGNYMKLAMV